jgi:hypothetical protein
MTDNIFETVKSRVNVREFAGFLGLSVDRAGFTLCLFHAENTPSMKLYDNGFFCYGCGEGGDVVALAAAYWGVRPYDAAKELAAIYGIPTDAKMTRSTVREWERVKTEQQAERELCKEFERWRGETVDLLVGIIKSMSAGIVDFPRSCARFQAVQVRAAFLFDEYAACMRFDDDVKFYEIYGAEIEELKKELLIYEWLSR